MPTTALPELTPTLRIAFFTDKSDVVPRRSIDQIWDEFASLLVDFPEASPCTAAKGPDECVGKQCPFKAHSTFAKNLLVFIPADMEGDRVDKSVKSISALVLDFDNLTPQQTALVLERLAGWTHARYTTHNHRPDSLCFRVVLPLARPVLAGQWHRFLPVAIQFLGVTIEQELKNGKKLLQPDRVCKNRSRIYYRQTYPKDMAQHAWAQRVDGKVLNPDEVLAWGSQHVPAVQLVGPDYGTDDDAPTYVEGSGWDLGSDHVLALIDAIDRYLPAQQRHRLAMALAGALRRAGATKEDARHIIYQGYKAGGSEDPLTRANVVDHTWALPPGAMMTGYTSIVDILPLEDAEEIGELISTCVRAEFLGPLRARFAAGEKFPQEVVDVLAPQLPASGVNLGELRAEVQSIANSYARSDDRKDKVIAELLRRVLRSEALAQPGGHLDPVTRISPDDENGVEPKSAVVRIAGALAWGLPLSTPAASVAELARFALNLIPSLPSEDFHALLSRSFTHIQEERGQKQAKEAIAREEHRERVREALGGSTVSESPPASQGASQGLQGASQGLQAPPQLREVPLPPPELPDGPDWQDLLIKGPKGDILSAPHNARLILANHEDFLSYIRWNAVTKDVEVTGGPLARYSKFGAKQVAAALQDYLFAVRGMNVTTESLEKRVYGIARQNEYDPLQEHLRALRWDGVEQTYDWLRIYLHATSESEEYLRLVGRRWLVGLVARALEPGCKMDNVLVLEGIQGALKSLALRTIGGQWFCDSVINIGDKDSRMYAARYWICEMAEIVALKRGDYNLLKNFFAASSDEFRPPYGDKIESFLRRCVFVGSTNEDTYLVDETGNRRYLPVKCAQDIDLRALAAARDQLLAEAVAIYDAAFSCPLCRPRDKDPESRCSVHRWWFTREEMAMLEKETDERVVETAISMRVQDWWYGMAPKDRPPSPTTMDVYKTIIDSAGTHGRDPDLMKIGSTFKKMGFTKKRDNEPPRHWRWYATPEALQSPRREKGKSLFLVHGGKADDGKEKK